MEAQNIESAPPPWLDYHPGQDWPTDMLPIARVIEKVGMSRAGWYRAIGRGEAPAGQQRGGRVVWDSREIEAYNRWQADTLPRVRRARA